jgi:hypothetical protein
LVVFDQKIRTINLFFNLNFNYLVSQDRGRDTRNPAQHQFVAIQIITPALPKYIVQCVYYYGSISYA